MTTAIIVINTSGNRKRKAEDYYKTAIDFALGDLVHGRAAFPHPDAEFYKAGKTIFNHVMDTAIDAMYDELVF